MNKTLEKIEDLGWDAFFQAHQENMGLEDFAVARVIAEYKGAYKVKNAEGEFLAKITGKQMFTATSREDYPAVGDWAAIKVLDDEQAVIQALLPRKSIIKRKFGDKDRRGEKSDVQVIAANMDVAFIVQAIDRDYSLNRFERYFSIVKDEGIKPAIIINKIDLISNEELDSRLAEIKARLGEVDVILTSTVNNAGVDELRSYIEKGKTYCFLGSSGVGKSSLINSLLGGDIIKTGSISEYANRGKHVTTNRETYFLENGGIVIDNPGVREVGLTDAGEGVDSLFEEIALLAKNCKYADCTHVHEPGCEILAALQDGRLEQSKYANYISLKKEAEHYEMSEFEKREKNRQFGKFMKKAKKDLKEFRRKDY